MAESFLSKAYLARAKENFNRPDADSEFVRDQNERLAAQEQAGGRERNDVEHLMIYIPSTARDRETYPNPSSYQVSLSQRVDRIVEAQVVGISMTVQPNLIDDNNDAFAFEYKRGDSWRLVEVYIEHGRYHGHDLAAEINVRVNHAILRDRILSSGVWVGRDGHVHFPHENPEPWFFCEFRPADKRFFFRFVQDPNHPANVAFALLLKPKLAGYKPRLAAKDVFELLGFDRKRIPVSCKTPTGGFRISNTDSSPFSFGVSVQTPDLQARYAIWGNKAADLVGANMVVLDMGELNGSNVISLNTPADRGASIPSCMGVIPLPVYSTHSNATQFDSSGVFPLVKKYRGKPLSLQNLQVNFKYLDGEPVDFNFGEHLIALRITQTCSKPGEEIHTR